MTEGYRAGHRLLGGLPSRTDALDARPMEVRGGVKAAV